MATIEKPVSKIFQFRADVAQAKKIEKAIKARHLTATEWLRSLALSQADQELAEAESNTLQFTPVGQVDLMAILNAPVKMTKKQKDLAKIMQGKA